MVTYVLQKLCRFRTVVSVQDTTANTTLTLFNKEAEQLVSVPLAKNLELGQVIRISTWVSQYTLRYHSMTASLYTGWRHVQDSSNRE